MFSQLGQIVSGIAVANRNGICTKGFMTFGCGCPKCIEEMHRYVEAKQDRHNREDDEEDD